jgi:hypothetical protein
MVVEPARHRGLACALWAMICSGGCASEAAKVEFFVIDGHELSTEERQLIESIADSTAREVKKLLPALALPVRLRVQAGREEEVIPETGENGNANAPAGPVVWTVVPTRPGGVAKIARTQLRSSLFHELHHLVRRKGVERSLMEVAISEGMATAFERDFAGAAAPWGHYPPDVSAWVEELRDLPATAERKHWLFRHPDGRRWVAYKAGTYLVDRAMCASGKSSAELASSSSAEVLSLASSSNDAECMRR